MRAQGEVRKECFVDLFFNLHFLCQYNVFITYRIIMKYEYLFMKLSTGMTLFVNEELLWGIVCSEEYLSGMDPGFRYGRIRPSGI